MTYLAIIRYTFSLLYGVSLSAAFAGVKPDRRSIFTLAIFTGLELVLQWSLSMSAGNALLLKTYPLTTHLPLILMLIFILHRPWHVSLGACLSAYLCCEFPNWISKNVDGLFNESYTVQVITYVISAVLLAYLIWRFVAEPLYSIFSMSRTVGLTFSIIPAIYYIWDYTTSVYTTWMVTHSYNAAFTLSVLFTTFFVVFVLVFNSTQLKYDRVRQEKEFLEFQFLQSQKEFDNLKQMQALASGYRHDMRHYLRLISGYAAEGSLDKIQEFVKLTTEDLDSITPQKFCANGTVNLILSYYSDLADARDINLRIETRLPEVLPLTDSELCSLLANGIENAFNAVENLEKDRRTVDVKMLVHRNNLLLSVENYSSDAVVIENGVPVTNEIGHGFGTRSIAAVAAKHDGQALFTTSDSGLFTLQVVIPIEN